ncbi:MAG TPA: VWA domain-containing protein, partial [Terriglobia bacterium]|nr:VWA domain-containing protein [Terriglobia bacterium]
MTFLAMTATQAIALALLTAGAIVALYFLKLRRRRVLTSSLLLWRTVLEQRQARSIFERLRNPLSLILAVVIGLLLALALARPDVEALTGRRKRVTIVLDTSPTMQVHAGGETRWQRAVREAVDLLDAGGPTTEFRLVDTSGHTDTSYSSDRSELRRWLSGMRPHAAELRFPAVDGALSDGPDTETWLVSDGVAPLTVPDGVRRISVLEEAPNVGIVAFEIRPEPSSPLHYTAYLEAQNYGKATAPVKISIVGAERSEIRREAALPAGGRFQEVFDLSTFSGGAVTATVQSDGDAFDMD